MFARVRGFVDRALGTAIDQSEDVTAPLIGGSVENVRIGRIYRHIHNAGVFANGKNGFPGVPAIGSFVEPTIAAGSPQRSFRGDKYNFAVPRIDDDAANVLRLFQPKVFPVLAAVVGAINAIAVSHAALAVTFTRAHPHYRRIVGIERHPADGIRTFFVEDGRPCSAVVGSLPDSAGRNSDVVLHLVFMIHRKSDHAPGSCGRTNQPELKSTERVGGESAFLFFFGRLSRLRFRLTLLIFLSRRRLLFLAFGRLVLRKQSERDKSRTRVAAAWRNEFKESSSNTGRSTSRFVLSKPICIQD